MASENQSSRRLAAILFADVVGYTKVMQRDEKAAAVLLRRFQIALEDKVPKGNGEIINFYGDGAFCIFQNPLEAMQSAIELQQEFQNDPKVPVRIGLHSGTVVIEGGRAYGDNVNIASRIESMGIPGAILVSKKVRDELKNQPDMLLPSLGKFEFKNVEEPMEVFALANEGFVVPERSQIQGKLKTSKIYQWKPIAAILALLVITFLAYNQFSSSNDAAGDTSVAIASIPNNSIAVLPFDNMSADAENEYFSEGIHDDLLTHISKIGDLKVISRTSVLQYKDQKPPLPEIAKTLGVAHVMEGSVRRAGNQIRINVQLIKAETDDHIWSEIYDRELTPTNIFDIQTEIAKEIATALNTSITADQNKALSTHPTENLEAYESYLKGRQLVESRNVILINEALPLIKKSIELDPNFALAYVKLGEIYYLLIEYAFADSETNYALAWEALDKAKSINNNLAEAYALESTLYHYDKADIEGVRESFEKAIALNPNYATAYFWYSHAILEIERDFRKAQRFIDKAILLNPLSSKFLNMAGYLQLNSGNYEEAQKIFNKIVLADPDYPVPVENLCFLSAHQGRLDSSTIKAYEGLQKNLDDKVFLFRYIEFLQEIQMISEVNVELNNLEINNRQDSIFLAGTQARLAFLNQEFDQANQIFGNLKRVNRDLDPNIEFRLNYFTRNFQEAVKKYESIYPEAQSGQHLDNYMIAGYNNNIIILEDFQEYIYALKQIGQDQKQNEFLNRFRSRIVTIEDTDSRSEKRRRLFFQSKDYIIQGNYNQAIMKFEEFYDQRLWYNWQYDMMDPALDPIRNDPRFQEIESQIRQQAAQQRETFRTYLLGKD